MKKKVAKNSVDRDDLNIIRVYNRQHSEQVRFDHAGRLIHEKNGVVRQISLWESLALCLAIREKWDRNLGLRFDLDVSTYGEIKWLEAIRGAFDSWKAGRVAIHPVRSEQN